jgi:hypothetical protein
MNQLAPLVLVVEFCVLPLVFLVPVSMGGERCDWVWMLSFAGEREVGNRLPPADLRLDLSFSLNAYG